MDLETYQNAGIGYCVDFYSGGVYKQSLIVCKYEKTAKMLADYLNGQEIFDGYFDTNSFVRARDKRLFPFSQPKDPGLERLCEIQEDVTEYLVVKHKIPLRNK